MSATSIHTSSSHPGPQSLETLLGRQSALWMRLHDDLTSEFGSLAEKWSYSGKTDRWSLQLKRKKRTILYMIPRQGYFLAAFALGEKACTAAQSSELPESVLHLIERAPKYPEGRGVWLEVRSKKDVLVVEKLAELKMEN